MSHKDVCSHLQPVDDADNKRRTFLTNSLQEA